jgi:hypothetical protein
MIAISTFGHKTTIRYGQINLNLQAFIHGERVYFCAFTLKNFGFRAAHNVEILFDRELNHCDIENENLFGAGPTTFHKSSDDKGRTILMVPYINYNDGVIVKCCSKDSPKIIHVRMDDGYGYQDIFRVKTFRAGMIGGMSYIRQFVISSLIVAATLTLSTWFVRLFIR